MEVSAKLSHYRAAPRKVRLMADEIRGKGINEALVQLQASKKKRLAGTLGKLLKSAVANADQKGTIDVDTLFVKKIIVGGGPILKRYMPRAKGSASPLKKRTSHIYLTLAER